MSNQNKGNPENSYTSFANDSASGLFKASHTSSSTKSSGERSASGLFSSSQSSNNQTTNTSTTSKGK